MSHLRGASTDPRRLPGTGPRRLIAVQFYVSTPSPLRLFSNQNPCLSSRRTSFIAKSVPAGITAKIDKSLAAGGARARLRATSPFRRIAVAVVAVAVAMVAMRTAETRIYAAMEIRESREFIQSPAVFFFFPAPLFRCPRRSPRTVRRIHRIPRGLSLANARWNYSPPGFRSTVTPSTRKTLGRRPSTSSGFSFSLYVCFLRPPGPVLSFRTLVHTTEAFVSTRLVAGSGASVYP